MKISFCWCNSDTLKYGILTVDVPKLIADENTLLNVDQRQMAYDALSDVIGEDNIKYCHIHSIASDVT